MYKFTKADVDNAIIGYGKKGYQYTREDGVYYLEDIPVKRIYEHILFDKFGKDTIYDGTKTGVIQRRLKKLGYILVKKNKAEVKATAKIEAEIKTKTKERSVIKNKDTQSTSVKILSKSGNVLDDLIDSNQKLWIVGTGISKNGSKTGHYYSDQSNQFWKLLYQTGITKSQWTYFDDVKLCELSIGLTDFFPNQTGADKNLDLSNFKNDIEIFINKVKEKKPKLILVNGKLSCCNKKQKEYIKDRINSYGYEENKTYFICHSSSSSNNGPTPERLREWQHVADIFNSLK